MPNAECRLPIAGAGERLSTAVETFPRFGKIAAKISKDWKFFLGIFQTLENPPGVAARGARPSAIPARGSALVVALWVLMILSLLIAAFAFDMHVEAGITSYYRKRVKAQYLARAGVEWAKVVLAKSATVKEEEQAEEGREDLVLSAIQLSRGMAVRGLQRPLGEGHFTLDIVAEEGRLNVNQLSDEEWENLLDQSNVPEERWPELIDCFQDWVDDNDEHHLNGAESDDPFYVERGYECKNAPLDTVDELLLIKGFDERVVYGGPAQGEDELPLLGIAQHLTVWGDGKINVNSASREVLMLLPEIDEWVVDDIIEGRKGVDGEEGTRDDGFESVAEVEAKVGALPPSVKGKISTSGGTFVRVVSIGEVQGVRSGIWCVLRTGGREMTPVFWREENMP